ncbi:hypothetical protein [Spiroplasma cantharicola]|uniref:Uncharacterized protein n=1 Tax=Spiroplasma cantharicola TaxID=362837 RepID=A0A0M3SJH2_9MOLU|nr:hypothetical protein [Spiroplasma cantharicola]ALD66748.1 hypothetical protein SCANT_v1c08420 [Spiroplasma cantharicola]
MIKILKLLFTIIPFGTISSPIMELNIKNLFKTSTEIEEHNLEKEPYYLLDDQKENISTIIRKNNSAIFKSKINKFISLEELKLEHMQEFWFDSSLELNFKNIVQRNSSGLQAGQNIKYENLEFESYKLNINLDKRQESKTIEKEYSYHDKWTDTFIYTKLNLEFKKVFEVKSGLVISGTIEEEILKDKIALKNKKWGSNLGAIESGGLLLTNLKTNFISRKNYFQDKEEKYYTVLTDINTDYRYSREKLQKVLNSDDKFFKYLNIKKEAGHIIEIKSLNSSNLFQTNLMTGVVELKNNSQILKKNIKVFIKGLEVNTNYDNVDLNFESSLKNINENHHKIKYFISKKYNLAENEISFNIDSLNNSKAIKDFKLNKSTIFKYDYKKPSGKILSFNVSIKHTNNKSDENIEMSKWNEMKFEITNKNYQLDNYSIISESNIQGNELEFKEILTSFESITLKRNEVKELFILNGDNFRKINYKYNKNLNVQIENKNILKLKGLEIGKTFLEIDSIDAKNKKTIEIEIIPDDEYFELETNEITIKKGEFDSINLYSNSFENLIIVNKNKNIIAILEEDKILIKSNELGLFEIEVFSNITKESEIIKIEIIDNKNLVELDKNISLTEVNTLNTLNIINFDELNENELTINSFSNDLLITREKERITFISRAVGKFKIELKYRNQILIFEIYCFNKFTIKEIDNYDQNLIINKNDYELKSYDKNINLLDLNGDYNFSLKENYNIGIIEIVNKKGEYINIRMHSNISEEDNKEDKEDKENNEKSKVNNNWTKIMALCLIPLTFGVSLVIFLILKKKLKKASL